jgi:hypothetical protein
MFYLLLLHVLHAQHHLIFWMSHVGHDTFPMVMSFLNDSWEPNHVTMGIFEVQNTTSAAMAN